MIAEPMTTITVPATRGKTPYSPVLVCQVVPVKKSTSDTVCPSTPSKEAVSEKNFAASVVRRTMIATVVTIESTAQKKKKPVSAVPVGRFPFAE
jgi:hypothetical protein